MSMEGTHHSLLWLPVVVVTRAVLGHPPHVVGDFFIQVRLCRLGLYLLCKPLQATVNISFLVLHPPCRAAVHLPGCAAVAAR
jgi:hypothetical protein